MSTPANKKLKEWILSRPNATTGDKIQYILDLLKKTLLNDRGGSHGDFASQMRHTEYLWNVLDSGDVGRPINPRVPFGARSCFKNQLQKMSRATSGAFNFDDFLDNAGYAVGAAVAAVNHYTPGPGSGVSREAVASEESREAVAQELEYIITANTTGEPPEEVRYKYSQEALLTAAQEYRMYVARVNTDTVGEYVGPYAPTHDPMSLAEVVALSYTDEKRAQILICRADSAEAHRTLGEAPFLVQYTPWSKRWDVIHTCETDEGVIATTKTPLALMLKKFFLDDIQIEATYTQRPDIKEVYPQQQFNPS